jgi:hypothetical protein
VKIVILPMDNRPPNYQFIKDFAQIYNLNISLPEKDVLGGYQKAGDVDFLMEWLNQQTGDCFIISVEMLCYGGLVFSRDQTTGLSQAIKRISLIKKLKKKNPNAKIYLSSVVRRALITVNSTRTKMQYDLMNEYLQALGKDSQKAFELEKQLPEHFIDDYRHLRKRNHLINIACLDDLKDNVVDLVVFAQEDTFPNGPQKGELKVLNELAKKYDVREKVFIHNGADEVVQELLIRTINNASIDVVYDSESTKKKIMDYEDRCFEENVNSHLNLAGFKLKRGAKKVLLICGSDVEMSKKKLDDLLEKKREVYLCDVFYPNGSNPILIKEIIENLKTIKGYSAWNTASNSLGTALAQSASSEKKDEYQQFRFFLNRLIDDHLYQGVYRKSFEDAIQKNGGEIYNLKKGSGLLKAFSDFFIKEANRFLTNLFKGETIWIDGESLMIDAVVLLYFSLPWDRTFECEIDTEYRLSSSFET